MKRWTIVAAAALGFLIPAALYGNPLDLLTRTEKGTPLTQAEFDNNYILIENAIHALGTASLENTPLGASKGGTGAVTLSGLLKGNGTSPIGAATAGTDYQSPITASGILKGAGAGSVGAATAGTDYQSPITGVGMLKGAGAGSVAAASVGTDYQAPITATGLLKGAGAGSVGAATAGTDYQAAITSTGLLKGAGSGAVSAATAGTDYQAANANLAGIAGQTTAADRLSYWTGASGAAGLATFTAAGRTLAGAADVPAQLAALGTNAVLSSHLTAVVNNTTVTPAPTGLSVPVVSGHYYSAHCNIPYNSGVVATGIGLAIVRPATNGMFTMINNMTIANNVVSASNAAGWGFCTTVGSATSGTTGCQFTDTPSTSANSQVTIDGSFSANANGNFTVESYSETAGNTVGVKIGATCVLVDEGT